jgi:hypothetical protein
VFLEGLKGESRRAGRDFLALGGWYESNHPSGTMKLIVSF